MQLFGTILLVALFIYAFPLAILLLLIAGLIFRTKETVGLLAICGVFAGLAAQPLITIGVVAAVVAIGRYYKNKEKKAALPEPDD